MNKLDSGVQLEPSNAPAVNPDTLNEFNQKGADPTVVGNSQANQFLANGSRTKSDVPSSKPPKGPSPKTMTLARGLFWVLAFSLTTTISATVGATLALVTPLSPWMTPWDKGQQSQNLSDLWRNGLQYRISRPVNILVMGIDRVPNVPAQSPQVFAGRSDTMLLLHIDPTNRSVSLLSIPRDTRVEIPTIGSSKINQANVEGGPALSARVVSRTLNDVPIDRYVRVSTEAFRELVDLLGGIDVYVPKPMSYVDYTQKLKIDLAQGWQTLNGDQAEQFARFRHDEYGDIGRVQRQQALLKALRERLTNPTIVTRIPDMIRLMSKYIDTNLSLEEMLALANFGLKLDQSKFRMVMLPGRFSQPGEFNASYWVMDEAGRDRVLQKYFAIEPKTKTAAEPPAATSEVRGLRIAIQNASSQPHAASDLARYLQGQGFQNVYVVEDWGDRQRATQIIAQQGDLDAASLVKRMLGSGNVEADSTGDLESDLTIRVGEDLSKNPTKFLQ